MISSETQRSCYGFCIYILRAISVIFSLKLQWRSLHWFSVRFILIWGQEYHPKATILAIFLASWWFQPMWKNTSIWIISPKRGENKTYLKPPPRNNTCHIEMPLTVLTRLVSIHQTQRLAQLSGTPELQICEALHLKAKWKITPLKTNMTGWQTHHEWRCITF